MVVYKFVEFVNSVSAGYIKNLKGLTNVSERRLDVVWTQLTTIVQYNFVQFWDQALIFCVLINVIEAPTKAEAQTIETFMCEWTT